MEIIQGKSRRGPAGVQLSVCVVHAARLRKLMTGFAIIFALKRAWGAQKMLSCSVQPYNHKDIVLNVKGQSQCKINIILQKKTT